MYISYKSILERCQEEFFSLKFFPFSFFWVSNHVVTWLYRYKRGRRSHGFYPLVRNKTLPLVWVNLCFALLGLCWVLFLMAWVVGTHRGGDWGPYELSLCCKTLTGTASACFLVWVELSPGTASACFLGAGTASACFPVVKNVFYYLGVEHSYMVVLAVFNLSKYRHFIKQLESITMVPLDCCVCTPGLEPL